MPMSSLIVEGTSSEVSPPFASLTIVGLGLIGGSFALASRSRFPKLPIVAIDTNSKTCDLALRQQVVDICFASIEDALPELQALWCNSLKEGVERPHLLILACHLEQNLSFLEELAPAMAGCAVIGSDIGSCKRAISEKAQALHLKRFIPAHPMAGKAVSGFNNATDLLFVNKGYLLCPLPENTDDDLACLEVFIQALGGQPRRLAAQEHDRAMAYVSHLPQLYATLLANLLSENQPENLLSCSGGGLDEQLRLAASSYAMWGDILRQNQDNVQEALAGLRDLIDKALTAEDPMMAWQARFQQANAIESAFQKAKKTGAFLAPVIESAS
jgi:prephenate dehydrogenase